MNKKENTWGEQCSEAVSKSLPNPGLVKALELLKAERSLPIPGYAIDLGCGLGRDTKHLLKEGWSVLAVDKNEYVINKLNASIESPRLTTQIASFEDTNWRPATLINAALSLPYCPPEQFGFVWAQVLSSLIPGGIVIADFFGYMPGEPRHEPMVALYSHQALKNFFSPLEVEFFQKWYGHFVNASNGEVRRLAYTVIASRKRY